ncbi:MAG: GTPase Era [Ruminococcaceae bacterium]|nr:GTPase Era [Oscillospiraceae bacterium]
MKRTAFIAIVGRPNVGKSTLLNALMGEKIAIVSKKPQTTRNRITGILTKGDDQYVFLDTPGMHKPKTKLGDIMVKNVRKTVGESDAVILVVDASYAPGQIEEGFIERIKKNELPAILVINKTDKADAEQIGETIKAYSALHDFKSIVPIAAIKNDGTDIVLKEAEGFMKEGEWFFPETALTDQPERQIASEIIREKLLRTLDEEIPHGTAVIVDTFEEGKNILKINATVYCEKESHKGIIIGKGGETLKKIGTYAREDMEAFFETKVFLNIWVKVKENWRDSQSVISNFGFKLD